MKLEYLKEFILVAEIKNFTKVAEKLYITQSTLTRHIIALEEELGINLITRSTHDVYLTQIGMEAYKTFKKILEQYNDLSDKVSIFKSGVEGHLCIGMLYYVIEKYVSPVVDNFSNNYPNINLDFMSYQPHQVINALIDDKIDIGLIMKPDDEKYDNLNFQTIKESNYIALMSKEHRLAVRSELTLNDIKDENVILLSDDTYSNNITLNALKKGGFKPEKIIYTKHIDTVPFAIQKNGAIHITSEDLKYTFSSLCAIPIDDKNISNFVTYAYKKDNINPAIPLFLNEVIKYYNKQINRSIF